ncbi:MAG: hypothetical protein Q9170_008183, partial [Blastenia crenularia]
TGALTSSRIIIEHRNKYKDLAIYSSKSPGAKKTYSRDTREYLPIMLSYSTAIADLPAHLTKAVESGDFDLTQVLYTNHIAANPSSKPTLLKLIATVSANHAHPHILSYCFTEGLTLNSSLVNDPLIYAANNSASTAIYDVLINEGGWDVNQYLEMEGDALTSAAYNGNIELAEYLLAKGANPNSDHPLEEYTFLLIAGDENRRGSNKGKMLKLLLSHGANVKGTGALIAAAEHRNVEAVKMILEMRGEEVDLEEVEEYGTYDGRKLDDMGTALYKVAAVGCVEIVDILLQKGASREFRDRMGRRPADVAREKGLDDVLRRRLEEIWD